MMTIKSGEFWIAKIPFTNGVDFKKRPVLVLWLDAQDVVVAVVISVAPRTQTDVKLRDWKQAGLRVVSTVRLSRLDCLEKSLLLARIGCISANDAQLLQQTWKLYIKPQF